MQFYFVAHDLGVLCFLTLLWENLPLLLQRKMVTSRGKIIHLTSFLKLLMKYLGQTSFLLKKNGMSTHILVLITSVRNKT